MSTVYILPSPACQTLPSQDLIAPIVSLHRNGLLAIQMTHMHRESLLDCRIFEYYTKSGELEIEDQPMYVLCDAMDVMTFNGE